MESYSFEPIGIISSCFKQKFSIPRQSGLVEQAEATVILEPEYSSAEIIRGLDQYSHIWVIFVFHKSQISKNKHTVRPPRLGGEKRMGVFATRSNYRPNPIGQSVVKLESVAYKKNKIHIKLSGIDFLDGTPVLDIKPYIPYADSISEANTIFAAQAPEKIFTVKFSVEANFQIDQVSIELNKNMKTFIETLLSYDVRPKHVKPSHVFATKIFHYDLKWTLESNTITVISLTPLV